MSSGLEIRGIDKLMAHLKKCATLEDVKQVVRVNGAEMHQKTQRFAPVDTGALKRNIRLDIENQGMAAKVTSEAEYAPYQEYGTRYMAGTPHVRPAFRIQSAKFKNDMQRLVK
ncbi:HK97 gp10 family phage protein [Blautia liquoris]|uniref:HK97 gp10 family phage protein n=1 Tax=Blautia liquoris TaxID=2779518 RepID=A0A7M2RFB3_9FIRM|nr:HK97-gp10 family putative phage morphogenesis protein [Blautia liquoris]QOV19035.1 HK97 gp10 family phage protein [Blautia liquoris]